MAARLRVIVAGAALWLVGTTSVALLSAQNPPPQGQQQTQQQGRGQGRGGQQGQGQQGQGQQGQGQGAGRQGGQAGQAGQGQAGRQGAPGQPRDNTSAPQTGTAGISGAVVLADSGRPVRRARVTLNGQDVRVTKTAVSDDQGNFAFTDLPGGRYTLAASKPGYVNAQYGQKKPGRPGTPIQLIDTQKLTNLKVALPKGGVLTGTVLDENGEPTPGTQVTAFRYEMRTGQKQLTQAGSDQTDDRGQYRIYGLMPGDYVVRATPRNRLNDIVQAVQDVAQSINGRGGAGGPGGGPGGAAGGPGGRGGVQQLLGGGLQQLMGGRGGGGQALQGILNTLTNPDESNVGYAPVYYPGTTTSSSASTVALGVSEERQGLDFQLQLVNTANVSGQVITPDGDAAGVFLTLVNETEQALGANLNTARVQPDGTFTFTNVAPGQYMLQARAGRGGRGGGGGRGGPGGQPGAPPEQLWGQTQISVDGRPLTGVSVSLQPGMHVNGHLTFEGAAAPTDLTRVRVALAPAGTNPPGDLAQNTPAQLDATGHFTISGVAPGRYTMRVQGGVQTFTLRAALVGNRDILDFPLEVKPNEDVADITMVMTTKTQELTGTLTDAQNQPATGYSVIVFSADPQFWTPQSRRIASVRPGTDGRFTARNLPAGDYLIAAVTDVEPGEWFDPEFLQQLRPASARVTLNEGDKKTQDLRLSGAGG